MNTFAVKEKRSLPVPRNRSQPSRFEYRSPEVKAQQTEIHHILRSTGAQAKLTIGQPNDKYEQEADRVADQVMQMSDAGVVQRVKTGTVQSMKIQRMCSGCEEEMAQRRSTGEKDGELQTKAQPGYAPMVGPTTHAKIQSLKDGGQPLPSNQRTFYESRMGHDFSGVRIHDGIQAAESAQFIQAKAYTLGNNIVFGSGKYSPETNEGKRLLAHELTHVVQQGEVIRRYRNKKGRKEPFNFGADEDSFIWKKDKQTKPWIRLIKIKFDSTAIDANRFKFQTGNANVHYFNNPVKKPDFSFKVTGGSRGQGKTDKGKFIVHSIKGEGYNSGKFSGTEGVDFDRSNREGPGSRYSKNKLSNMSFAVFYNKGEALHAGPLDLSSHGCVHVDWGSGSSAMKQVNHHSVIGHTKVHVS